MEKVNIRAVAAEAGVSPATVSRALNGSRTVDPALARRAVDAARALGYQAGRSPADGRIAFVVPALEMTYYSIVANGMIEAARRRGWEVVIMVSDADPETEEACLRAACRTATVGVVYTPVTGRNPFELVPALRGIPMVVTGPRHLMDGVPHVYQDNYAAGYMGTRYLLRLGHRRVAFIVNFWMDHIHDYNGFLREYDSPARGFFSAYDRYAGYCAALAEEGLAPDPELVLFGGFSYESGCASARQLLASSVDFDSVVAPNDRCGAGVLKILGEQGLRVPQQISLICLNGGLISEVVSPTLTMIEMNNREMGVRAVERLDALQQGSPVQDARIEVRLVIKNSTQARRGG